MALSILQPPTVLFLTEDGVVKIDPKFVTASSDPVDFKSSVIVDVRKPMKPSEETEPAQMLVAQLMHLIWKLRIVHGLSREAIARYVVEKLGGDDA